MIDVELGRGTDCLKAGDIAIVSCAGKLSDATIFDSSSCFEFTIGVGEVVKRWDVGIVVMRINGIRNLEGFLLR